MIWLGVTSFSLFVIEAFADYCGDELFCDSPYRCCETKRGCCYDSMLHHSKHFRLQIWNMWYFWFLIIFMMMSCFGGCGYYRRRRLALLTQSPSPPLRPTPRHVLSLQRHGRQRRANQESRNTAAYNYFAYNGPGVIPPETSGLPPAYAEVMSQPAMYPPNKVELPPYPGLVKPDGQMMYSPQGPQVDPISEPAPPPYSEFQYGPPPSEGAAAHIPTGVPAVGPEQMPPSTDHSCQPMPSPAQTSDASQVASVMNAEGSNNSNNNSTCP
ncbi:proline-rich protein 2 isoform X1 [Aplysia californica]|uniref:WW domain binding protein VOPP1 n=2 Tax=Aplysia californica TaxID=6500 RepID=A0ABM0JHT7_APLCA|nr:proline-rich protein 2 isoform X1 [Aplysia californica]